MLLSEMMYGRGYETPVSDRLPPVQSPTRTPRFQSENSKLYCLMLTLIIMCGSGVLIAVLVAGIIYAVQQAQ